MTTRVVRTMAAAVLAAVAAACGGSTPTSTGGEASSAGVEILGRVADRGTRGPILVFAYTDLAPGEDPSTRDAASLGTLTADGTFDMVVPPCATLAVAFLADGSNDGAVDEGDPLALLTAPELADLQGGDRVHLADVRIDFTARKVMAAVEVSRIGEPAVTPTAIP